MEVWCIPNRMKYLATGCLCACLQVALLSNAVGQTPSQQQIAGPVDLVDSPPPTGLAELVEIQTEIRSVLPRVLPSVVSVEGGSGVIVTSDGVILTASHVTEKAGRIVDVRFSDGRVVTATTLGTNYNTDTAALKINSPGPWPHLSLTDSAVVQAGDWCLALGYPLSFPRGQPAATRVGRILSIDENQIVTDCPIMGGDSGGPLLNLRGNLIGISSRVKNGISDNLHVPIQLYLDDWKQLADSVDVRKRSSPTGQRAYLGIQGETDFDRVRIRSVHRGSPAESAGLLAEDVLMQLAGKPIGTFDDVLEILDGRRPGERVVAELNRSGQLMSLPIELGSQY